MPSEPSSRSTIVSAVIVAGGTGVRAGVPSGKQMAIINGEPMLAHTVRAVAASEFVSEIVLVCHPERVTEYKEAVSEVAGVVAVAGGDSRTDSVKAGISAARSDADLIFVHDGARPLVSSQDIDRAVETLVSDGSWDGVVLGHPVTDTLKEVRTQEITATPDRSRYWAVQTPQVFRADVLRRAYEGDVGSDATDDSAVVELSGGRVRVLEGSRENIKVTRPEDIDLVGALLSMRDGGR